MEYSVAKAIQNLRPTVTKQTYLHLSSTPQRNVIFPGVGHIIKHTNYIVSLPKDQNMHKLSKRVDEKLEV